MSLKFAGYSENYHNAALAIIDDETGVLEYASQSERYSKKKNDAAIHPDQWRVLAENPFPHVTFYEERTWTQDNPNEPPDPTHTKKFMCDAYLKHHISHCATAFYTRPWSDRDTTVMVSIDGVGEHQTGVILDNQFNLIKELHWPKSVGMVYTTTTVHLGLRPLEDEYVVMGLSSYGEDKFSKWLIDWYDGMEDTHPLMMETDKDLSMFMDRSVIRSDNTHTGWYNQDFPRKETFDDMQNFIFAMCKLHSKEDVAASVQVFAEYAIMQIMHEARKHGSKLVYSGGCAQNVVINSKIYELFDEMHIAVEPTDAGSALGCAAHSWALANNKDQIVWSPYAGYDIKREIDVKEVVDHLLEHRVCGIANGKAEFGPRALGNRSLIADVRYDVKDTVNTIKRRQMYRPFAPAILEEHAHEYFSGPMNEYMQYTAVALHDYKSVTHVDGTARVQIVKKDCPSIFRKIIEEYYARTGVPMLLNTSLNIRGRPMVNDEHDAALWEQKYGVKVF